MRLKSSGRSNLEKSMQVLLASLSWFRVISRIPISLLKMSSWKSSTRSEIMWWNWRLNFGNFGAG